MKNSNININITSELLFLSIINHFNTWITGNLTHIYVMLLLFMLSVIYLEISAALINGDKEVSTLSIELLINFL